ncbi:MULTISPECIES: PLP-dependent aspartate aminotransferase family protein [unclassified Beijerinckia]|uniref:trans-sulfuration enzyme family protein n=1 Tax=unclassified Beijerinckia TaxID=2638183 RepID=UPI0008963CB2|nr:MULTISPECIES: PLP-dependent aspartate aminotransferase family protein [unclassified Beijerinckia]MDH7798050.1 cystathionine gamma-synthase [Beijerinckia sp. GAS462]SED07210.1 cystathionine gamma-synthase [Beijerinckia sp. 28-YEA-48]
MAEKGVLRPRSLVAQALGRIDGPSGAIVLPIHVASTYERDPDNGYSRGNSYGRADNPTARHAEEIICKLEGGAEAMVLSSGMSAALAVFLALKPGDRIIAPTVLYWALRRWLMQDATKWGLVVDLVDMRDLAALEASLKRAPTALVWIETPANPLWHVCDIAAIAKLAHAHGALLAADSTVATPILTRPLSLGADIVMHSATKYLNGHSDVIAGALVTTTINELWSRIAAVRSAHGMILGPFEAHQLIRGMRTLDLRVRACCESAQAIAETLSVHAQIDAVLYPGLPDHPEHAIAARQMHGGFGGMLSIRCHGGAEAAIKTAAHVRLWKRATSLGSVESLVEHRASVEGPGTPCPDDLLRLSVGIEDPEDLLDDLDQALRA